jgi:hypothetical protein
MICSCTCVLVAFCFNKQAAQCLALPCSLLTAALDYSDDLDPAGYPWAD